MTTKNDRYDCIVIGGGPSGMMAAGTAAKKGASVLTFNSIIFYCHPKFFAN